ncbi:MAG: hypothetical protein RR640_00805 [Oscillospiraceae bacterium]
MYTSLEGRVYDSYLKQSPNKFMSCDDSVVSENAWIALYNWTRNTYKIFANNPELLINQLHDDCDLPYTFDTYSMFENGDKIKTALRKAITTLNNLLQFIWQNVLVSQCNDKSLVLSKNFKISKKYITMLRYTRIIVENDSLIASNYSGMFCALKELTKQTDGFAPPWNYRNKAYTPELSIFANGYRRFVRCLYTKDLSFF